MLLRATVDKCTRERDTAPCIRTGESHMLERFESVKNVGLFQNYSHSSGREFGTATLIYGENGVGKTTLAAILDSIRERNPSEILRRRSLPGNTVPAVAVVLAGKQYLFDGKDWSDQPPYDTIDVFYPGFVTRNVHAATAVDPDHRRNLCEFVLGRKAVEAIQRLAVVDGEGRTALNEIRTVERELQNIIKPPDTLEKFLGLSNDAKIDDLIKAAQQELTQAQSKDAILARAVPKQVLLPPTDRVQIEAVLAMNCESVGGDMALVVRSHIANHLSENGERWLQAGVQHLGSGDDCPFCGQPIVDAELVAAIRSFFGEEYRRFSQKLADEIEAIRQKLGTAAFVGLRQDFSTQFAIAAQWAHQAAFNESEAFKTLDEAEVAWKSAAGNLGAVLASKTQKPFDTLARTAADDALSEYQRAVNLLANLNGALAAISNKADECKKVLTKADTAEIQARLNRLENRKLRFATHVQGLLDKRTQLLESREKLAEEKPKLKKDIDEHASRVVEKYQTAINYYLEHFGCDIRIDAVESKYPSGRASVQFVLKANGHAIELGVSTDGPCFETVLSEGDKYTLALAFFLARLKHLSSLAGRTIVLDDPVNSLGSSRRILIANVVRELHSRGAQIVVLTHDDRLAAMRWRDRKLNKAMVSLHVERTDRGSRLEPWDIERATQTDYVKHYLALNDYLGSGGDHEIAAASIRPYVEQRLRHLYPGPPFETRDSLGEMIAKVRSCSAGGRLSQLHSSIADLDAINTASLPAHHATDDVPGMSPLSSNEVRMFAQKALAI
jgi:wobble nucleotide-excising tRNase